MCVYVYYRGTPYIEAPRIFRVCAAREKRLVEVYLFSSLLCFVALLDGLEGFRFLSSAPNPPACMRIIGHNNYILGSLVNFAGELLDCCTHELGACWTDVSGLLLHDLDRWLCHSC